MMLSTHLSSHVDDDSISSDFCGNFRIRQNVYIWQQIEIASEGILKCCLQIKIIKSCDLTVAVQIKIQIRLRLSGSFDMRAE